MDKEHFLALRVMRLTKPSMLSNVTCFNQDDDPTPNKNPQHSKFQTGQLLSLPQSFGNIFLGETFVSYISVHNDGTQDATNIEVKADLQTGSQRINMSPPAVVDVLLPDHSLDDVVKHEVKELGTHILVCTVSYKNPSGNQSFFRKFFKFQVLKPLDVKTKFYNTEPNEVFLEAQIQNITNSPMYIDKVGLEPSTFYTAAVLNSVNEKSTFGSQRILKPKDTRQYLYKFTLKPDYSYKSYDKTSIPVGKLDIVWKTTLGERGRLQTSQLQRPNMAQSDVTLRAVKVPSEVFEMAAFKFICEVCNCSEQPRNLMMKFENQTNILWKGSSGSEVQKLDPKSSTAIEFTLLPVTPGLLVIQNINYKFNPIFVKLLFHLKYISGLRIIDTDINRTYEYDYIHQVLVHAKS